MSITGLILAGGASRRMGSPKALLDLGGETFLDRLIRVFQPHCSKVIVVLGYHADVIRAGAQRASEVEIVLNPEPERGQLSSLKCGLAAVPEDASAVMFMPVDYPRVQPSTVASIASALERAGEDTAIIVPRHSGKNGHPVCIRRELLPRFLDLPDGAMARDTIHQNISRTLYLDVDDAGILRDIDDPESYRELLALSKAS